MWNSLVSLPVQPPEGGLWMSASAFKTNCQQVVEDWMVRVERAIDSSRMVAGQRTGSALLNIADRCWRHVLLDLTYWMKITCFIYFVYLLENVRACVRVYLLMCELLGVSLCACIAAVLKKEN